MNFIRRMTRWDFFILLAFLTAIFVRFFNLDKLPLTDSEATLSLQALDIARGLKPNLTGQPFYILGTSILFYLFDSTTFLARFLPAFFGSILVFLPGLLRKKAGDAPTVILAFLLAVEPGLVAASRVVGGDMLALVCVTFALAYGLKRRFIPTGGFAALALLSGSMAWHGILVLGLTILITHWLIHTEKSTDLTGIEPEIDPTDGVVPGNKQIEALISGGLILFVLSMLGFFYPSGLSAAAASLIDYLTGWFHPSGVWATTLLVAVTAYSFLILLFGGWGILQSWLNRDPFGKTISLWFVTAFILAMIHTDRTVNDLLWAILPLAILAARSIAHVLQAPGTDRSSTLVYSIFVFILSVFIFMNLAGLIAPGTTTEMLQTRVIIIISSVLVLLVATVLVASGWSVKPAVYGLTLGLLAGLILVSFSVSWGAAATREQIRAELWGQPGVVIQEKRLLSSVGDLSDWRAGDQQGLEIDVVNLNLPSLNWALRNHPYVKYLDYLPSGSMPSLMIMTSEVQPQTISSYRGQDFLWSGSPDWANFQEGDWLSWLLWRMAPYQNKTIILWARSDLFPGGALAQPGSSS